MLQQGSKSNKEVQADLYVLWLIVNNANVFLCLERYQVSPWTLFQEVCLRRY